MESFSGPVDETERRRMGNQRFIGSPEYAGRGPLDQRPVQINNEGLEQLKRLTKLEKQLKGVDSGIVEVEQHIIDRLKAESGASNIKLLAEALEIVTGMRRRGD